MIRNPVRGHLKGVLLVSGALLFALAVAFGSLFWLRSSAATRAAEGLLQSELAAPLGVELELGGVEANGWDEASARSFTVVVDLPPDSPFAAINPGASAIELTFARVDIGFQPLNLLKVGEALAVLDGTVRLHDGRARLVAPATTDGASSTSPGVWLLDDVEAALQVDATADRLLVKRLEGTFLGAPIRLVGEGLVKLGPPFKTDLALEIGPVRLQRLADAMNPQTLNSPSPRSNPLSVIRFPLDVARVGPHEIVESRLRLPDTRSLPRLPAATTRPGRIGVQTSPTAGQSVDGRADLTNSAASGAPAPERTLPGWVEGEVRVSGSIKAPHVHVDAVWMPGAGAGSVRMTGSVEPSREVAIELDGERVPVGVGHELFPQFPDLPGQLTLSGTVSGTLERPTFALDAAIRPGESVSSERGSHAPHGPRDTPSTDAERPSGEPIALHMQGGRDGIEGRLDVPEGTLQLLAAAAPGLEVRRGGGALVFQISGSWENPSLSGKGNLRGLSLWHPYVPEGIEELDIHVNLAGDRIEVDSSSGRSGRGRVSIAGEVVGLLAGDGQLALHVRADGLKVRTPDFRTKVTGALDVTGPVAAPTVRGGLVLSEALLQFGTPLSTAGPSGVAGDERVNAPRGTSGVESGSGGDPDLSAAVGAWNPELDVVLKAAEDVRIKYPDIGLDVWATGTLHMGGMLRAPNLSGVAEGTRGRLRYLGIRFLFNEGEARFAAHRGLIPVLNVTGETHIEGATVLLHLQGELDQLQVDLHSDPPMPDSEILARLGHLTGGAASGDKYQLGWSGERLIGAIWEGVRAYLASGVERAVAGLLTVDEFRLSGTLQHPEVQIGKYVGEGVYATYALPVKERSLGRLGLEWRPQPDWRLSLSVDASGLLEMGTQYRLRF